MSQAQLEDAQKGAIQAKGSLEQVCTGYVDGALSDSPSTLLQQLAACTRAKMAEAARATLQQERANNLERELAEATAKCDKLQLNLVDLRTAQVTDKARCDSMQVRCILCTMCLLVWPSSSPFRYFCRLRTSALKLNSRASFMPLLKLMLRANNTLPKRLLLKKRLRRCDSTAAVVLFPGSLWMAWQAEQQVRDLQSQVCQHCAIARK